MSQKVWSRSWLSFWFFTSWGSVWALTAFVVIGTWDDLDNQRALLANHVEVPALIQNMRLIERNRGSDTMCLDVLALLPGPTAPQFSHCATAFDVDHLAVGDTLVFLVSPDGQNIARKGPGGLAEAVESNSFWQPVVRLFLLWLTVFHLWRFVPALFARRLNDVVWVKVNDVRFVSGGVYSGDAYLRIYWEDPVTEKTGRTRDIRVRMHMPNERALRKRKGLRMYRTFTGRLWWEAELPGFANPLSKFPGPDKAGWPSSK